MATDSMFDKLVEIPLFRGVTHERMAKTVGGARFHFLKYNAGDTLFEAGEACTHIKFVLSGQVRIDISNADERFRIQQTLTGPDVILPEFLFGLSTVYPGRCVAIDDVSVLQITKADYMKILTTDEIFMYNLLNYLSMNAQKCVEGVLAMTNGSIEERLAMWVVAMTQPTATDITVICKQKDLNAMFGVQRSSFIAALEGLQERGIVKFRPGIIHILDRRAMLGVMRQGLE